MNNINNSTDATKQTTIQKRKRNYWLVMSATIIGALIYFVWPLDPIPDIVAGLGQIDDFLVALIPVISHIIMVKREFITLKNN